MWYGVDPKTDKSLGWSPYRYSFWNPLRFVDPDGKFEVDKATEKAHPELVKYLKGLKKNWDSKGKDFKDAFMKTSGLSEKEVVEMLTYGTGPKLEVAELDKDSDGDGKIDKRVNGTTSAIKDSKTKKLKNARGGKGLIKLDNDVVNMYENASTMGDKLVGEIMVESTLFHEGTHYGNMKKNGNGNGTYKESGKSFEKKAYGKDIGRNNVKKYWESLQPKKLKPLPAKKIN